MSWRHALPFRFPARWARVVLTLFAFAFAVPALAALFGADSRNIREEVHAAGLNGRRLAVFFELPDCAECLKMKRRVFSSRRAEASFGRLYRTARINLASDSPVIDAQGNARRPQEIAEHLRIFAAPSLAFFTPDGKLEYRHTGSLTQPSEFLLLGRFVSEAAYEKEPFSHYLLRLSPKH
ncbi:MAG: hypothetical protein LBD67_02875 [Candidatus Accumulibacter sp.]|jgi:protein SCO1/2|nr:hypothetical protein [Accumulibacter sp.]